MAKVKLVTDSTSYLDDDYVKKHNITVVPLKLNWDGETFRDNVDIKAGAYYQRLATSESIPTTSQPSAGDFHAAFKEASRDADGLAAVLISSGISGTVDSALLAKQEFDGVPLEVIDSRVTAGGLAILLKAMVTVAEKGASLEEVVKFGKSVYDSMGVYFMVDTLKYLHKGGRIGGASALLGTALDLKPILYLSPEGKIAALEKVRSRKKAISRMVDIVVNKAGGKKAYVGIMQAEAMESALAAKAELEKKMDLAEIDIFELSPVVGTHVGPGTLGIAVHTTAY